MNIMKTSYKDTRGIYQKKFQEIKKKNKKKSFLMLSKMWITCNFLTEELRTPAASTLRWPSRQCKIIKNRRAVKLTRKLIRANTRIIRQKDNPLVQTKEKKKNTKLEKEKKKEKKRSNKDKKKRSRRTKRRTKARKYRERSKFNWRRYSRGQTDTWVLNSIEEYKSEGIKKWSEDKKKRIKSRKKSRILE